MKRWRFTHPLVVVTLLGALLGAPLGALAHTPRAAAAAVASQPAQPSRRHLSCRPFPGADQFSTNIDNPYLPLVPGTTYTYRETVNGRTTDTDVVQVTAD